MRVLALDLGAKRIGLAISDRTGALAFPLRTVTRSGSFVDDMDRLAAEVQRLEQEEDGLGLVVVGLPRRLDGTPTDQTQPAIELAEALRVRVTPPVVFQDERLTSREAESRLALTERDWRKRKARLDAAAAAVILQDFLEERRRQEALEDESEEDPQP